MLALPKVHGYKYKNEAHSSIGIFNVLGNVQVKIAIWGKKIRLNSHIEGIILINPECRFILALLLVSCVP